MVPSMDISPDLTRCHMTCSHNSRAPGRLLPSQPRSSMGCRCSRRGFGEGERNLF